jgi:3-oxoacyl-[acyl-carrier protein] reductase
MNKGRLLEGKICLVTGTNKGIGKAVAERFVEEGAILYAHARTPGCIDEWVSLVSEKNDAVVVPVYFDVQDSAAMKEVFTRIIKEHQRFDVLVNNAGVVSYEMMNMINIDSLREMFDVNVISVIQLMQFASRLMARNKAGSIINISSIVGEKGVKGQLGYAATKGAVISLTKSAAKELAAQNIRVNAVAPGMIGTERFLAAFEKNFKDRIKSIGMGRLGSPEDVADACVFLGSDMSAYITGQIIGVDGSTVL